MIKAKLSEQEKGGGGTFSEADASRKYAQQLSVERNVFSKN